MNTLAPAISIVSPLHNEEGNAEPLYQAISHALKNFGRSYEIIFVNDCSTDRTLDILKTIHSQDPHFHYCDLAANVGENWSLLAGISKTQGQIIVTIDGDFQNDPANIPTLVNEIEKGYLAVNGWRRKRQGHFITRVLPSIIANALIARLSGIPVHDCGCGLKAYRREFIVGCYVPKGFMNRFSPVAFGIKAHQFNEVEVTDRLRKYGQSHYGLSRIFIVLSDLWVVPFLPYGPAKVAPLIKWISLSISLASLILSLLHVASLLPAWPAALMLLAGFWSYSVHRNLQLFVSAQKQPLFVIKDFQ